MVLCVNHLSAGTDFRRQILTSTVDPRTEPVKYLKRSFSGLHKMVIITGICHRPTQVI